MSVEKDKYFQIYIVKIEYLSCGEKVMKNLERFFLFFYFTFFFCLFFCFMGSNHSSLPQVKKGKIW